METRLSPLRVNSKQKLENSAPREFVYESFKKQITARATALGVPSLSAMYD